MDDASELDDLILMPRYQSAFTRIEQQTAERERLVKVWVSTLTNNLPPETLMHVQRRGCEPPSIEVNGHYFVKCTDIGTRKGLAIHNRMVSQLASCMRTARRMAFANALVTNAEAESVTRDAKGNMKLRASHLRATNGVLPDRYFRVVWTAHVTELLTDARITTVVTQSPEHMSLYDVAREGKRTLTEHILRDDAIATFVDTIEAQRETLREPIPTSVTIRNNAASTITDVSYNPIPEDTRQ